MKEKLKNLITKKKRIWIPVLIGLVLVIALTTGALVFYQSRCMSQEELDYYIENDKDALVRLYTDYNTFEISNGVQKAVFVNGQKVSGSLPIKEAYLKKGYDSGEDSLFETYGYKYNLLPLSEGQRYKISYNSTEKKKTGFSGYGYSHEVHADNGGTVFINSDWEIETRFAEETVQTICLCNDNSVCRKLGVIWVSGISDSICASWTSEKYIISSRNNNFYRIEFLTMPQNIIIEDIEVDKDGIVIQEISDDEAVILKGKEKVMSLDMSECSVKPWLR